MRDLYHSITVAQVLNPVVSTTTKTSGAIDLQGYNSAVVLFAFGQSGDTLSGSLYWTLKLQASDDDSTYADVGASDLLNSSATVVIDATNEDKQTYKFGYIGTKRYLKGIATPTGSHSIGTPIGIVALKGHPSLAPAA
jgi:hypothetical protein